MDVFTQAGVVAAGFGKNGWWKCTGCGEFAGFESDPTASAVTPFCRNPDCKGYNAGHSCVKVFDPLPEEVQKEMEGWI